MSEVVMPHIKVYQMTKAYMLAGMKQKEAKQKTIDVIREYAAIREGDESQRAKANRYYWWACLYSMGEQP